MAEEESRLFRSMWRIQVEITYPVQAQLHCPIPGVISVPLLESNSTASRLRCGILGIVPHGRLRDNGGATPTSGGCGRVTPMALDQVCFLFVSLTLVQYRRKVTIGLDQCWE